MSILGQSRARRYLMVIAALELALGGTIMADEPAPFAVRSADVRLVRDSSGRFTALEYLGCPEATLAALKAQPDLEAALAKLLKVHVADEAAKADQPAVLGTCSIDGKALRFTPRYPFRPGLQYRLTLQWPDSKATEGGAVRTVSMVIEVPDDTRRESSEVVQVYPSAALLPENHLRFYIHFSRPMSRGEAYEHLHLLDEQGRPIARSFLELGEELWDASGRRLTLLIDPGRIKRGLQPREELGAVLEAGHAYALVVDARFPDAAGRPLAREFRKSFKVGPPVATAIDPSEWKIQPPRVDSTAPVVVRFPRSLDRALMERSLAVVDADGKSVAGRVLIGSEERRWEYLPDDVWAAGSYELVVDPVLEDLAGNQVGRAFEVDEKKPDANRKSPTKVRIPFRIVKDPASAAAR